MKLLSIDYIPGTEIEALGMVKGTVVQTKNIGRDFMAGMKKPFESMSTRFLPMENWNERATRKKCVLLVSVSRLLSITSMSSYPLDTVSIQSRASLFVNGQTPS